MIVVLGETSRLGKAISCAYPVDVVSVPREVYGDWCSTSGSNEARTFLKPRTSDQNVVYICAGVLDPNAPAAEHYRINFQLPSNILEVASELGWRVITFGTIMERFPKADNPYVSSKRLLGKEIEDRKYPAATHVRIHTQYGKGAPHGFMFLGQIATSILNQKQFQMTSGKQLREYHHVADDARAILEIATRFDGYSFDLNSGNAVHLCDLAATLFSAFGCTHLLELGVIPDPQADNYKETYDRPALLSNLVFRDTFIGVIDYFAQELGIQTSN